ncbi:MAG: alpha/beta hydrolase [Nocardioidaceae bacterium]
MSVSRRRLLAGGAALAVAAVAGAVGVEDGVLPGRTWAYAHLGLDGPAGRIPDVAPGRLVSGSFVSKARLGRRVGWSVAYPPGASRSAALPVVVVLHGRGGDHTYAFGRHLGLDRFLAQATDRGVPPFAVAGVDGGDTYWHARASGEDAAAMVVDELLPLLAGQGLRAGRSDRVGLRGIDVRIDCGTGDPFYPVVRDYVAALRPAPAGGFEPGGHTMGYWRRMAPAQLAFLGHRLS